MEDFLKYCIDQSLKSSCNSKSFPTIEPYPEPKPTNIVYVLMSLDGDKYEPRGYVEGVYTNLADAKTRAETFVDSDKSNYLIEAYDLDTGKEIKQYSFKREWTEVNW